MDKTTTPTHLSLLGQRRFAPFLAAQFEGVFVNHLFKTSMLIVIAFDIFPGAPAASSTYGMLALGLYALPHLVLASLAGQIADRMDKVRLLRLTKAAELVIMLFAWVALSAQSLPLLMAALFLFGAKGSFLAALEYSVPPLLLERRELLAATGLIQASGVIALLTGQIAGGAVASQFVGLLLLLLALGGCAAAWLVPAAPAFPAAFRIQWNVAAGAVAVVRPALADPALRTAIAGISWFFVVGAIFTGQFAALVRNHIAAEALVVSAFLTMFVCGTVGGAIATHRLLRGTISTRLTPIAAAFIAIFILDFALALSGMPSPGYELSSVGEFASTFAGKRLLLDVLGIGAAMAVMVVPLYGVLQTAGPADRRARDVAANNIVNAVFVLLATGIVATAIALEAALPNLFFALGLGGLAFVPLAIVLQRPASKADAGL